MDKVRTEKEVDSLIDRVTKQISKGGSRFRGMTYEEGIRDALDWAFFDQDDPYED